MPNPFTTSPHLPALPAFPFEEFEGRLVGLQKKLAARGIAAALLSNASNVAYYSGFRTTIRSANLVWAMLVVPASGAPHAIVSQPMSNLFRETSWIPNVHAFGGSPYWKLPTDPLAILADIVAQCCESAAPLAIERSRGMRPELTLDEIDRLRGLLAGHELVDIAPIIWSQRVVKTPWEQQVYRRLGQLTADGFRVGLEAVGKGVREQDVERRMWQVFLDGGADASPVGGQLMIRSGPERHLTFCGRASPRTLRHSDQLMLAGGPALEGYHIDIHRFANIGPVADLQRDLCAQSEAGLAAAIRAVRPGVTARSIFAAAYDAMVARQATAVVPWRVFGHGVGLDNYEPPLISADDDTVIERGMVLALEVPAYDVPASRVMGAFFEECVLVTDDGAEVLTDAVGRALWTAD